MFQIENKPKDGCLTRQYSQSQPKQLSTNTGGTGKCLPIGQVAIVIAMAEL